MSERGVSVSLTCGTSQTVWSFGYSNIMLYVILLNQGNNSFFLQTLGYPPFCSESPQGKNSWSCNWFIEHKSINDRDIKMASSPYISDYKIALGKYVTIPNL